MNHEQLNENLTLIKLHLHSLTKRLEQELIPLGNKNTGGYVIQISYLRDLWLQFHILRNQIDELENSLDEQIFTDMLADKKYNYLK